MDSRVKELWAVALTSGEFKQGRGKLCDFKEQYCCFGVLCELYRREHSLNCHWSRDLGGHLFFTEVPYKWNNRYLPPDVVFEWAGLPNKINTHLSINGEFKKLVEHSDGIVVPVFFPQIAAAIREQL